MPTVNELPDARRTAALLSTLRRTVAEVTAREAELRAAFEEGAQRLERREGSVREKQRRAAAAVRQAVAAKLAAGRERLETRLTARATWAEQAADRARQFRERQVEAEEGRVRYRVQRDQLRASRNREQALKEAEERFEAFMGELGAEEHVLATLEIRAADSLAGYGGLARRLRTASVATEVGNVALPDDPSEQLDVLRGGLAQAGQHLDRVRRTMLPLVFRHLPVWLPAGLLVAGHAVAVYGLPQLGRTGVPLEKAAVSLAVSLGVLLALWLTGCGLAARPARTLTEALKLARERHAGIGAAARERHAMAVQRIEDHHDAVMAGLEAQWAAAQERAAESRTVWGRKLDAQRERVRARHERLVARWRAAHEQTAEQRLADGEAAAVAERNQLEQELAARRAELERTRDEGLRALEQRWREEVLPVQAELAGAAAAATRLCPPWEAKAWQTWESAKEFVGAVPFGVARVEVPVLTGGLPAGEELAFPEPHQFVAPLALRLPQCGSVWFGTDETGRGAAVGALNCLMLRLLALVPPGKLDFTLVDPVELGQSFAGFMHLADYEEQLINGRIWTQSGQIEERLAELNAHVEKVTQMYLRNDYASIVDYNQQAGRMAEKYRFLVVADFPTGFTEVAVRRLLSIVASGPRCGVYVLLHRDRRQALPVEVAEADLRQGGVEVRAVNGGFRVVGAPEEGVSVSLDPPPPREQASELIHRFGRASVDAGRVEVPFEEVAPDPEALWSAESVTELRVPIGVTGATKRQELALGRGTRQHVLVAGKTGSGKSNLFHVLITNLALWHAPDQVEFYLVDFKKGVEFKCYATYRLPHARVVAIESDREFGLSVLQRVDEELRRRGELFRARSAQDLAGYHRAGGVEKLPRTLLLIDEFQEFFVEDDRISQNAALLLDRIVRQGRAFGIHVVLGSQTLGGAYTLARTTLGQMVVRVALQCNEADAYLIMDEDNPAPRLLSRPGEAIYNDAAGMIEGNSPFQVVWLDERTRDRCLQQVRERAETAAAAGSLPAQPVVFEGNAPADVTENPLLQAALAQPPSRRPTAPQAWLGAPNAIKGPTAATFARQNGNHLLMVGQRDESILALLGVSVISLAAQHPAADARFVIFSRMPVDSPARRFLEGIAAAVPQETQLVRGPEVAATLATLAGELDRRTTAADAEAAPALYVLIHELPKFKELRPEDEFSFSLDDAGAAPSPAAHFQRLINEGAALGMHLICTCDSGNSLSRFLNRKALGEFDLRVVFQMSANDSAMLIDTTKANDLGLHRAVFHNGQEGVLETFRPYALPDAAWLEEVSRALAPRRE